LLLGLIFCAVLMGGVLFTLASLFCKVAVVTYSGKVANYDMGSIIAAADITVGSNIFSFDKDEVEETLQKEFPLLDGFEVQRILPDKVNITAELAKERYVLADNGICYVVSEKGRLMRRVSREELGADAIVVEGVAFTVKGLGQEIRFTNEEQKQSFENLLSSISAYLPDVTYLDVSLPEQLTFHIGEDYVVNLGGDYQIDYKLQMVKTTIEGQNFGVRTYLDASIEGKVFTRPYAE